MHLREVLVPLLLMTALVLSGCLEVPAETHEEDPVDPDPGERPDDVPTHQRPDRPEGNQTDEDLECHEYSTPRPVPPEEQEVDSKEEIICAGQYTILDEGSGQSWSVPTWHAGDFWTYQIEVMGQCIQQKSTVEKDSGTSNGLEVYGVKIQGYDCHGEPSGNPSTENRTKQSLTKIADSGFIEHNSLFPLRDGKSWVYMNAGGTLVTIDNIEYNSAYPFGLASTVEAWHVEWTISGKGTEIQYKQVWGVEVKYLLKEEIITSQLTLVRELVDSNYLEDEDLLPLPFPL